MNTDADKCLSAALAYAALGWAVLPLHSINADHCTCGKDDCGSPGKHPLTPHGVKDASKERSQLVRWWQRWPHANVGIATGGRSGFFVLDVDGEEGSDSLWQLERQFGELPHTVEALTGGGGRHILFKQPAGGVSNKARLAPGLDVRGDGGYIVAPPSQHVSGQAYVWEVSSRPGEVEMAAAPEWLLQLCQAKAAGESGERDIQKGERNDRLTRLAGHLFAGGLSYNEVSAQLHTINQQRCKPPLPRHEVDTILRSIAGREANKRQNATTSPEVNLNAFHTTDAGQGEAIAVLYKDHLRYDHSRCRWLIWDGVRWREDVERLRETLAIDVARRRFLAALNEEDKNRRQSLAKWALQSENKARIESALYMARLSPGISVTYDQLNTNPWLLACLNGVVDLRTGELGEGQRDDLITLSTNVVYDPDAECPRWLQFLEEVFLGDAELIDFIQRAVGYSLTGLTVEQCFFLCYGRGANGKSVFLSTLRNALGEYGANTRFETFLDERPSGGIPNDIAALHAARLVTASEVAEDRRLNEGRIKAVTGQDPITARFMHSEYFTFQPRFKLWLAANHKPVIRGMDEAIWRRVKLIPFLAYFDKSSADVTLLEKLAGEAAGILAWAVRGCLRWQKDGLGMSRAVDEATSAYRSESDVLADFLDACTLQWPGARVRSGELYAAYRRWCEENKEDPMSNQKLGRRLAERGFVKSRDRMGWVYLDVGLVDGERGDGDMP